MPYISRVVCGTLPSVTPRNGVLATNQSLSYEKLTFISLIGFRLPVTYFFSGFGSCIAFASYNPPKTNFFKYALGISVINSATSIFAGMTIFAIVGSSAYDRNSTITDVCL